MKIENLLKNKQSILYPLIQKLIQEKIEFQKIFPTIEGYTFELTDRKISLVRLLIDEKEQAILRLDGEPIQFYRPKTKSLAFFPHKVQIDNSKELIEGFFFLLTCDETPDPVLPV